MANSIDISGLDKAEVFAALFNGSRPQGRGFFQASAEPMTVEQAKELLDKKLAQKRPLDFDYVEGRVMNVDITKDKFDPWLYDRDNGDGLAGEIIEKIKNKEMTPDADVAKQFLENLNKAAVNDIVKKRKNTMEP